MRRNLIIIGLTILVIFVVAFLSLELYREDAEEIASQLQAHQLSDAQHVSLHIKSYFENRSSGLRALSSFISLQYGEPKQRRTDLQAYFRQLKKAYVKAISVYDETGKMVDSTDDQVIELRDRRDDLLTWAKKEEHKGRVFVSPFSQVFF